MKMDLLAIIVGAIFALSVIFTVQPDAIRNFRYHSGFYDARKIEAELVSTVKQFDKLYVEFFTSGGDLSQLSRFPAAALLKRRIVQDINSWSMKQRIFSHDRHMYDIKDAGLFRPDMGYVETAESWRYILRDRSSGRRVEGGKDSNVRVRYILRELGGQWRVEDLEVYGADDEIPPLAIGRMRH